MVSETDKMQLDCLMEKLRSRNRRQKTAIEAIKIFHTISKDRKSGFDLHLLHSQLNSLRGSINVGKASYTLDRLEAVSMECGIKFCSDMSRGEAICYCDIFSFKFSVSEHGSIDDVIIAINSDSKGCPELLKSLRAGNFNELKQHLEGLNLINDISSDKKIKGKVVMALHSLESDLNSLSMYQNSISSIQSYVHRSPLGILVPRIGGLPMKLIYFVGPYDLLNKDNKTMIPMTLEAIIERDVGYSLTVGIEKSPVNNRIQIANLMLANNSPDGKNLPIFAPLNNSNSCLLPSRFVVNLKEPLVLSWVVISKIQHVTGIKMAGTDVLEPVVPLLVDQLNKMSGRTPQNQPGRGSALVVMPGKGDCSCFPNPINHNLLGCMVDKIAFTHPTHLPTIVAQLRQQILFNTLVCSCVKSMAILNPTNMKEFTTRDVQFEVVPLSLHLITATFQHPIKDSLLTIMLELNDSISVTCKMTGEHVDLVASNEYVTKVTQRCLSLPVVIRSIFKKSSHLKVKPREASTLPPLLHLSRQTSCLLPCPKASSVGKKYVAAKSLDSIGDERLCEQRSSIKISVPKLLANFSIPPRTPMGEEIVVKMEKNVNQENEQDGSNVFVQQSSSASLHLSASANHEAKMKKVMLSKSSESDVEIIEKPMLVADGSSFVGRSQNINAVHKADKVSSNPMLASLLDHSSGSSNSGPNAVHNVMGVGMTGLANVGPKQRKRPPANDCGLAGQGGRNAKKSKTSSSILSDEYYHLQHLQQQQQQLMSRNQISGIHDSGGGVKMNSGNAGAMKMSEVDRSMAVMARQMSDPTSFQNFAAWQNSTNCTGPGNMGGMGGGSGPGQLTRQQSIGNATYFDKDAMFSSSHAQQQNLQNRLQPKDRFKGNSLDGSSGNVSINNAKQFSANDSDWEVKIEPSSLNDSINAGSSSKTSLTLEKQPPIKVRFDKRTFTSSNSNSVDVGRLNNESSISSSPLSTGSSDMKRQMSSSLTDLLSDDNNHSNSADSEVGVLTSGAGAAGSMASISLGLNAISRCSSSPRLSIKRIGDVKDLTEVRGGILNATLGMVGDLHSSLKRLKSASLGKGSEEKKANRMYSCNNVSLDDSAKQKLSKKQRIYEFDDDECIVTASTSPITSQVPSGMPTIKITNAGGKLKIQNPLKSKQTAGLGGVVAGRSGQLSAMVVGQKSPKAFGSHHVQGHHQRLGKAAVRPKAIEAKFGGGSDAKGLSRTPSQTFIQSSPSAMTLAGTSLFQIPSSVTQSHYQQTKFKSPQCTTPMGFSTINCNAGCTPSAVMSTTKFNSSASVKSSGASIPTNAKSKSPVASGDVKSGGKKGSLSLVIDTLMKKQHIVNGADGCRGPEGAVAQKEIYDAIRLEIIREGNKPSTPTRDQLVASTSSKLSNNAKKLASDSFSLQSRNPTLSQFQPIYKNHAKAVSSKSPSPNNFSASSVNPGSLNTAPVKPLMTVSTVNINKVNVKSDAAFGKSISFNAGFASSSPPISSTFSTTVSSAQMFTQSRNTTESLDVALKSSAPSSLPSLPSAVLASASNSLLGFGSRAATGGQGQRSSVLSSQVIGARYQEKSPMKMQPLFNQDVALKMMKLNDISERLVASRHFLDVVVSVDNAMVSVANSAHGAKACNSSTNVTSSGNALAAPVVERLLSPPRSPSPGLILPACANSSPSRSPANKSHSEDQRDAACNASAQQDRADEFGTHRGKSSNANAGVCSVLSMSSVGRTGDASPAQTHSEVQLHAKPQKCQSMDFEDVVTVDDEKCETPDNDLVIDVSPSPALEIANKMPAATSELSSVHQLHLLPTSANVTIASSAYLLDLTNSPPSIQSEMGNVPTPLSGRPPTAWVPIHKSPPSLAGQKSQPSSVNSVMCEVDDDLMNEALTL